MTRGYRYLVLSHLNDICHLVIDYHLLVMFQVATLNSAFRDSAVAQSRRAAALTAELRQELAGCLDQHQDAIAVATAAANSDLQIRAEQMEVMNRAKYLNQCISGHMF